MTLLPSPPPRSGYAPGTKAFISVHFSCLLLAAQHRCMLTFTVLEVPYKAES